MVLEAASKSKNKQSSSKSRDVDGDVSATVVPSVRSRLPHAAGRQAWGKVPRRGGAGAGAGARAVTGVFDESQGPKEMGAWQSAGH